MDRGCKDRREDVHEGARWYVHPETLGEAWWQSPRDGFHEAGALNIVEEESIIPVRPAQEVAEDPVEDLNEYDLFGDVTSPED